MTETDLLKDIHERFDYCTTEWQKIREEGKTDMRYVAGDTWDSRERKAREDAGRPVINCDELSQHVNQLINDVRQNKRAVKVSPGPDADEQTAEFRANKIREIEYRSHAQEAYTTAFENAAQRSYGALRVATRYVDDESTEQEIWIDPIYNPDLVSPDPDALKSTAADMQYCFVHESRLKKQFKKEFPEAKLTSFAPDVVKQAPNWFRGDRIQIAEYWVIESKTRTLLMIQPSSLPQPGSPLGLRQTQAPDPISVFKDQLSKQDLARITGDMVLAERSVETKKVVQYLTNGLEILKTSPWAGKWIPIVMMYGKIMYVDSGMGTEKQILSVPRLARDPAMALNYCRTTEVELIGMTPKTPYMAYEGQFSPAMLIEVHKSLHEPVAALFAKAKIDGSGTEVLPLPQKAMYEPAIQALELAAESFRRQIFSAVGSTPLPTAAQRRNEKSGVALKQMDALAQRGSFHFVDHYEDSLRHVGVIIDDLIPHIYDTARDVAIRKPNDDAGTIRVNDPANPKSIDTSKGTHHVTISTGPAFQDEREEESAFADVLMASPFAPLIADLAVKLKGGGPVLDEMADRLTPPQFRKPKEGEGPDPAQLMQAVGQAKQENQQLKTLLSQIALELKTKKLDHESSERIALANIRSKEKIAGLNAVAGIKEAEIKTGSSETIVGLEAQVTQAELLADAAAQHLEHAHEYGMAHVAQDHALEQNAQQQQHALEQGQQGHEQALEQGDQAHAQTLEQTQQAADLAPEPTANA